jgi:hypothetical protein
MSLSKVSTVGTRDGKNSFGQQLSVQVSLAPGNVSVTVEPIGAAACHGEKAWIKSISQAS